MKNNHNFQKEWYAIYFLTENEADIFNEVASKNSCRPGRKFTFVDLWAVQKNYKRRSVADGIHYRF